MPAPWETHDADGNPADGPWNKFGEDGTPTTIPKPLLERLYQGSRVSKAISAAAALVKGQVEGASEAARLEQPLGLESASPEVSDFLKTTGFLAKDPSDYYGPLGPLRVGVDAATHTVAQGLDLFARLGTAASHGVSGGIAGLAHHLGLVSDDQKKEITAQLGEFGDFAQIFMGGPEAMGSASVMHATRRTPMGEYIDHPISVMPSAEDFTTAALRITDGNPHTATEAKLRELYQNHGVLPAEAVMDALEDPVARASLVSTGKDLPMRYVGDPGAAEGEALGRMAGGDGSGGLPPPGERPALEGPPGDRGGPVPPKGTNEWADHEIDRHLSVGEKPPEVKGEGWIDWALRGFVDRLYPLAKKVRESNPDLPVARDPYKLARLFAGVGGKIQVMLNNYTFDFHTHTPNGQGLKGVLAPVRDQLDEFRRFAVAMRAKELHNRGIETGIDPAALALKYDQHKDNALFKKTMLDLVQYQNRVAAYARDAGLLSRKGYDAMIADNQMFVPLHVVMDVEGRGIPGVTGPNLKAKQPFHKIKGSLNKRVDPLETIIKNTFMLIANADKNQVGLALVDMLRDTQAKVLTENPGQGKGLIQMVPENHDLSVHANEAIRAAEGRDAAPNPSELVDLVRHAWTEQNPEEIAVFRNGVRETYQIDAELNAAFKGLDRTSTNSIMVRVMRPFAKLLRAGAVLSPDFAARHLMRDYHYALATYDGAGKTPLHPIDYGRGLFHMVAGTFDASEHFTNWMRDGGGHSGMTALDRNYLQQNLRDLIGKTDFIHATWNMVRDPLRPLQTLNEWATNTSHLAAYIKHSEAAAAGKTKLPPGPETGAARVLPGPRRPGALVPVREVSNLPRHLHGDLMVRDGVTLEEAMRAAKEHVTDAEWSDIPTEAQASKKAALEAAWESRSTSVDMARQGAKTQAYNQIAAFFNAKVQDTARMFEALDPRNPKRALTTATMLGGSITLPSVLFWMANKDDSRLKDVPQWQKDLCWIWATDSWEDITLEQADYLTQQGIGPDQLRLSNGQAQRNMGTLWRIPKPFFMGVVFGTTVERTLDAYVAEKPDAFKKLGWLAVEQSAGDLAPTAVVPMIEQATNRSALSGRNVIPGVMEGMMPEYQYTPYTSELAKAIGRTIIEFPGMRAATESGGYVGGTAKALSSPILLENYARGYAGTLGRYALEAASKIGEAAGWLPKPLPHAPSGSDLNDIPFIKSFTVRYPSASEEVQTFFDHFNSVDRIRKTWDFMKKSGDIEAMDRIEAIGGEQMFMKLDTFKEAISNSYSIIRLTDADPDTTPQEKRQMIDGLYFGMSRMAEEANKVQRELEEAFK